MADNGDGFCETCKHSIWAPSDMSQKRRYCLLDKHFVSWKGRCDDYAPKVSGSEPRKQPEEAEG